MAKSAKLTSKGQITIPLEVRRALGVTSGDRIVFEQHGRAMHVMPARTESPFERFRGIGNPGIASGRKAIHRRVREMRGR